VPDRWAVRPSASGWSKHAVFPGNSRVVFGRDVVCGGLQSAFCTTALCFLVRASAWCITDFGRFGKIGISHNKIILLGDRFGVAKPTANHV